MKKVSTTAAKQTKNFRERKLTIGLDLGESIELVSGNPGKQLTKDQGYLMRAKETVKS
jgi:hypothetical protein